MIHNEFIKKAVSEIQEQFKEEREFGPLHLNLEDLGLLYSLGFSLYQSNDFERAETIFRRLVVADSLEKKHWWAFGAVLQAGRKYEQALTAWSMCCLFDDNDPQSHFHAAECFLSLEHKEEAFKALEAAKNRCQETHSELEKKITLLEQIWRKDIETSTQ
jgi:type III secretion system low calcium response chaperone LcrH/SycD